MKLYNVFLLILMHILSVTQVVQKQTLAEVGNWTAIWWPVVSAICEPKIIKIG